MINEQTIISPYSKIKTKILIFSALTFVTAFLPTFVHSQWLTGSLVNMTLILATFLIGPFEAVFLGLMPSVVALTSGLLPLPLAPAVPFIMISNAILVGIYHYLGRKNFGVSIIIAGFLKFLFLYETANFLLGFLLGGKMINVLTSMMGWPQFLTAVSGGILAYLVLFFIKS